jgi:hypothetical protein
MDVPVDTSEAVRLQALAVAFSGNTTASYMLYRYAMLLDIGVTPPTVRDDLCVACGQPIAAHFDDNNQKRSCDWAAWKP